MITAVARIFLISFFIIFCLALPVQAESVSIQHITTYPFGQVTANNIGINAYRRNLDRLRSSQAEASRSQPPGLSPTEKGLNKSPQPTGLGAPSSSKMQPQQQAKSTEQQQRFSFKKVFKKNSSQGNKSQEIPLAADTQSKQDQIQIVKEPPARSTEMPQKMNAYEIVEVARQPYSEQEGTLFSSPSFPKIAPGQLSEQLSERASKIHSSIRQQPERLNKTVVEPLQEKISAIKEQARTTVRTTFKEQIESRRLTGHELIEGSGVGDRIYQTKKSLKTTLIALLKQVEAKTHKAVEQLKAL